MDAFGAWQVQVKSTYLWARHNYVQVQSKYGWKSPFASATHDTWKSCRWDKGRKLIYFKKGRNLHTTEIWIPFFAANAIENLLKGAPENPLPRAFTYASYKIKTSMRWTIHASNVLYFVPLYLSISKLLLQLASLRFGKDMLTKKI